MKRAIMSGLAGATALTFGCSPSLPVKGAGSPRAAVTEVACSAGFSGPGARPVSATTVANWYIKDGRLIYAVFLRGTPGWYNKRTRWNAGPDSSGRYVQSFDVGGFRYSIALDESSGLLLALGQAADVRTANVILMDHNSTTAAIRASEFIGFCWASPPDAVAEVLARSKVVEQFVSAPPST